MFEEQPHLAGVASHQLGEIHCALLSGIGIQEWSVLSCVRWRIRNARARTGVQELRWIVELDGARIEQRQGRQSETGLVQKSGIIRVICDRVVFLAPVSFQDGVAVQRGVRRRGNLIVAGTWVGRPKLRKIGCKPRCTSAVWAGSAAACSQILPVESPIRGSLPVEPCEVLSSWGPTRHLTDVVVSLTERVGAVGQRVHLQNIYARCVETTGRNASKYPAVLKASSRVRCRARQIGRVITDRIEQAA